MAGEPTRAPPQTEPAEGSPEAVDRELERQSRNESSKPQKGEQPSRGEPGESGETGQR